MTAQPSSGDQPPTERPIVVGHREQLFHLIAEASEIEHTLMCSYLYAAFSLKTGAEELTQDEALAVARWRKSILGVAIEEMVHLLLMANLSIALGGRPHFNRPNFPVAPGYFPSGVVVKLTPFSAETLDHFIFLERPEGEEHVDGEGFEPEAPYVREEAHVGLMPSVQDYATVGQLYEALRLNLISASRRLGEADLFLGPTLGQIGQGQLQMEGVSTIHDLDSALQAIAFIVEQGEGCHHDRANCHYQRFLAIKQEYQRLLSTNPEFRPAWPAAESPVMRRPPEPQDKVFIDSPEAARLLDFANAIYGLLLRFLVQAFGRDTPNDAQSRFLNSALDLMHVLGETAAALCRLPASAEHPGINAGMTFTMLRSVEPLFSGHSEDALARERLLELADGARSGGLPATLKGLEHRLRAIAEANFPHKRS